MLRRLYATFIGTVIAVSLTLNTALWFSLILPASLLKVVLPFKAVRRPLSRLADGFASAWVRVNKLVADNLLPTRFHVTGVEGLDVRGRYFVCSNHQTWNDIHFLQRSLIGKVPFLKFFLKQELIWVPLLGLAWWGLDFPFMKRYTAEQIAKNPALRGKDIETTRRTCAKFEGMPVSIFNFLEGTRFTRAKHDRQASPYVHLLKPKAGGFAFTLAAMGERLNSLLDVTIVYPEGAKTFWQFLTGQVKNVIIEVRQLRIPAEFFHGDYEGDAAFRGRVQAWVSALWAEKDARIAELLAQHRARTVPA